MRTRFVLGPLMLLAIAGVFAADVYWTHGYASAVVLGLLAVAGVHEFVTMMQRGGFAVARTLLLLFTVALCASAFLFHWQMIDRELYPLVIGTALLLFPIALRSLTRERMARGLEEQGATLLGFILIAWPLYLAQGMAIRHVESVLYVVLVAKGGDIGAYLVGVAIGRHKLIPHISPGKTIEGAVGSVLVSAALAVLLRGWLLEPYVPIGLTGAALAGIMLNVTAQVGDLVESLLKRRCGVKNSSDLLPAHGGVLDLVDSLLFAFPAWLLILTRLTGTS